MLCPFSTMKSFSNNSPDKHLEHASDSQINILKNKHDEQEHDNNPLDKRKLTNVEEVNEISELPGSSLETEKTYNEFNNDNSTKDVELSKPIKKESTASGSPTKEENFEGESINKKIINKEEDEQEEILIDNAFKKQKLFEGTDSADNSILVNIQDTKANKLEPHMTQEHDNVNDILPDELDDWKLNTDIEDPRLIRNRPLRLVNYPFKQSYMTFLPEVSFIQDQFIVGPIEESSILVSNIPLATTQDQLTMKFSEFGSILHLELPKCNYTYSNLGIAKIVFGKGTLKDPESAYIVSLAASQAPSIKIEEAVLKIEMDPTGELFKNAIVIQSSKFSSQFAQLIHYEPDQGYSGKNNPDNNINTEILGNLVDSSLNTTSLNKLDHSKEDSIPYVPVSSVNSTNLNGSSATLKVKHEIENQTLKGTGLLSQNNTNLSEETLFSSQKKSSEDTKKSNNDQIIPSVIAHLNTQDESKLNDSPIPTNSVSNNNQENNFGLLNPTLNNFDDTSRPNKTNDQKGYLKSPIQDLRKNDSEMIQSKENYSHYDNKMIFEEEYDRNRYERDRSPIYSNYNNKDDENSRHPVYTGPRWNREHDYGRRLNYRDSPSGDTRFYRTGDGFDSPRYNYPRDERGSRIRRYGDNYDSPYYNSRRRGIYEYDRRNDDWSDKYQDYNNNDYYSEKNGNGISMSKLDSNTKEQDLGEDVSDGIEYCVSFESKFLPLFLATESELMEHFKNYSPKMVTKEKRCWVVIFDKRRNADNCLKGEESKGFKEYRLMGKLQPLEEFRNPEIKLNNEEKAQNKSIIIHKILPSSGLPTFKKIANHLKPDDTLTISSNEFDSPGIMKSNNLNSKLQIESYPSSPTNEEGPIKSSKHKLKGKNKKLENIFDDDVESNESSITDKSKINNQEEELSKNNSKDDELSNSEFVDLFNEDELKFPDFDDLPVHSTGSARTEGYYKVNDFMKQYKYKFSLMAAIRGQAYRLGKWIPYSTSAQNLAQQLEDGASRIVLARSSIHDWGLFAVELIQKGELVIEYVGELIRSHLADVREKHYLANGIDSSYLFRVNDMYVIDATHKGNIARFINHSCTPNCSAKITIVDNKPRILIFANSDIRRAEEITYDYQFPLEDEEHKIKCLCNTKKCRGFLN